MKNSKALALLIFSITSVFGCQDTSHKDLNKEKLDIALIHDFSGEANQLGFDLLKRLLEDPKAEGKNVVISPVSIGQVLGMINQGVATDGHKEDLIESHSIEFYKYMAQKSGGTSLHLANGIWVNERGQLKSQYKNSVRKDYGSEVNLLPLQTDPSGSATNINKWIAENTQGRIKQAFSKNDLSKAESLWVNTTHFKGLWKHAFKSDQTFKGDFHLSSGAIHSTPLMSKRFDGEITEYRGAALIRLPFAGTGDNSDRVVFDVVLPPESAYGQERNWIRKNALTADFWQVAQKSLNTSRPCRFIMPKFKLKYGREALLDDLKDIGLDTFLDQPITEVTDSSLKIGKMMQKTFIQIDESGAEAAAVTGGMAVAISVCDDIIVVDRPFMISVRDTKTDTLVFLGMIEKPVWED